jgi:hypothetical protein
VSCRTNSPSICEPVDTPCKAELRTRIQCSGEGQPAGAEGPVERRHDVA